MVLSDLRQNLKSGSRHTSLYFTPDITLMSFDMLGNLYANLSVSIGQLVKRDGTVVNPTDRILLGEELKVILNAPNTFGSSAASTIYQNNTVIGYFVLTTENEVFYSYDERYNDLLSVQVLPEINWVIDGPKELKAFDFDGNKVGSYDLNQVPTNKISEINTVVLDYHRNLVHVFDLKTKTVAKTISGSKPVSSSSYYGNDKVLQCTAIAFNGDNKIDLYDQFFTKFLSIDLPDVIGVYFLNNILYAWVKNSKTLFSYTFNGLTLTGSSTKTFDNTIQAVVGSTNLYVLNGTLISDLLGNTLKTIDIARNAVINSNFLYITHGPKSFVTKINLVDFSHTRINIANAAFLDTLYVQAGGRIYISDIENKKIYAREQFNQDWELNFRAFGLVIADQIYALDTYKNIPSKIDVDVLKYALDVSAFSDILDVPLGNSGTTGQIRTFNTNRPLPVQLFPAAPNLTLLVNGIPRSYSTFLNSGDVVTVQYEYDLPISSMFVGIAIDQHVFDLNLFLDDSRIVPIDFKFEPVIDAIPDSVVTSNIINVTALTNPVTLTLDVGTIILNGVDVGKTTVISNTDQLSIRLKADSSFCTTLEANATIENRFTSVFSVTTVAELPDDSDFPRPELLFATIYDQYLGTTVYSNELIFDTINFEPTEFTIPDIYNAAFIVNGNNVGRTHLVKNNESIRIVLDCSYNYDTAHLIPIISCYSKYIFTVYTIGDIMPDPFGFGTIHEANIKDYLISETAHFTGIGNNIKIPIIIPYGVRLKHNDVYVDSNADLDWRKMPLHDSAIILTMSNNDTLQLEGYPRPIQGESNKIALYVGGRAGYWNIDTHAVADTNQIDLKDHNLLPYNIVYDDLTKDHSLTVIHDVVVVTAKIAEISTEVSKQTNSKLLEVSNLQTAVVNSKINVSTLPDFLHTLSDPVLLDHERIMYVYNSNKFVDYVKELEVISTNVQELSIGNELSYVESNLHYIDTDSNVHTSKSVAHRFDQNLEVNHVKNIAYYFAGADAIYWNRNTQYDAELIGSNYLDAYTVNYDFINVQSEYVVVSFDYKPFQLFDLSDSTVFKYGKNPTITSNFIWQNVPWVTSEIEEIYCHRQPDIDVEDRIYEKLAGSDTVYYDPVYEWKTHQLVTFKPKYNTNDLNSFVPLDFSQAINYGSTFNTYVAEYNSVHAGNPVYFETSSTVFPYSINSVDIITLTQVNARSHNIDLDIEAETNSHSNILFEFVKADHTDRNSVEQVIKYGTVNQSRDYIRSPLPDTIHPGYFADEQAARSDSLRYGYQLAQIQSFFVEEKGWAWNRIIPCSNLCDPRDCPPSGYIHGG